MLSVADKLNPIKAHCAWGPCWIFSRCYGTRAEAANFGKGRGRERGKKGEKSTSGELAKVGEREMCSEEEMQCLPFAPARHFVPLVFRKSRTVSHLNRIGILLTGAGSVLYLRVKKEMYEATCPS